MSNRAEVDAQPEIGISHTGAPTEREFRISTSVVTVSRVQDMRAAAVDVVAGGEPRHDRVGVDGSEGARGSDAHALLPDTEVRRPPRVDGPVILKVDGLGVHVQIRAPSRQPVLNERRSGDPQRDETAGCVEDPGATAGLGQVVGGVDVARRRLRTSAGVLAPEEVVPALYLVSAGVARGQQIGDAAGSLEVVAFLRVADVEIRSVVVCRRSVCHEGLRQNRRIGDGSAVRAQVPPLERPMGKLRVDERPLPIAAR